MKTKHKRKGIKVLSSIVACSLCFSMPFTFQTHAENLEQKQEALEHDLSKMNHDKDTIGKQLTSATKALNSIVKEIDTTRQELDLAKAREVGQYEMMKKRIQYMYESSSGNFFTMLLESQSMTELLNRAEFFSTVSRYDREMLQKLQTIHKDIEKKESELLSKQKEMESQQEELNASYEQLLSMISSTSDEIEKYKKQIADAEAAKQAAEDAKKENEDSLGSNSKPSDENKPSENEKPAEKPDEDKKPSEKPDEDNNKPVTPEKPEKPDKPEKPEKPAEKPDNNNEEPQKPSNNTELALFAAILECEAGSTNYDGLLAVATVIMNRKESPKFPNTISGVIYQKGQFSPTWNGSLDKVLARGPRPLCYTVAKDALNGKRLDAVKNCYQFRAAWTGRDGTIIGGNVFF